ncbi:MAG: NTP transferase domain-containing protein [Acidobacteria bacterium]|nr:NTP transferase domain-containing protein [Acidobacteriota bacterium]
MKTVILCGGRGTRLGEHGAAVPKALIEIGGRPVLWHLLQIYDHHGLDDIILCLGYLGDSIKQYFRDDHRRITFVDTGLDTNTGGRIKRIEKYLGSDETFCVTYGDGLADVDLRALIRFHDNHKKIATLTAVHPSSNYGFIKLDDYDTVTEFEEKPVIKDWVNGGFFVFDRRIFEYLDDNCVLEHEPMKNLARAGELRAYRHTGFWKCMDTYKDNIEFNQLWDAGQAGWKIWR